jgi:hypothetical protein
MFLSVGFSYGEFSIGESLYNNRNQPKDDLPKEDCFCQLEKEFLSLHDFYFFNGFMNIFIELKKRLY